MSAIAFDSGFTLYGAPGNGEYATAIVNRVAYSASADTTATTLSIAAALALVIAQKLPGTVAMPTVDGGARLVIPGLITLTVRIGAPGRLGTVIDRQRQNIMLGVWSPNPSDRSVIGAAIKVAVARNLTVDMPDTSRSIWIAQSENLIDKNQNEMAYRRDLTVQVQWDTVDAYDAYDVTSVTITQNPGPTSLTRVY